MARNWLGWSRGWILGSLALAAPALWPAAFPIPARAVDSAAPAASDGAKERLTKLLLGEAPLSVDDLKLMQDRMQQITEKVLSATVGVQVGPAWGSGVIISKDGYVLTAAHVSGKPGRDVTFMLSDGRELKGKTLGLFRTVDAGLLKITDAGEYPHVEMGASNTLKEGQWCLATGHPGGFMADRKPVVRVGRVLLNDVNENVIVTDCTLVGGDSGGPLFDMEGKVIGVNSRIAGPITANMHVPVNAFREAWDRLAKGDVWGHMPGQEPSIGIRRAENSKEARIAQVLPNSPAERAGLQPGDLIVKVDDKDIADFDALRAAINERDPGDRIILKVKRGEELLDFNVKVGRRRG
jgi:serine protease Do